MADAKKPSLKPQNVKRMNDRRGGVHAWYYESKGGIEIIVQTRGPKGELIAIASPVLKIPAKSLMRSAKRCGWKVDR